MKTLKFGGTSMANAASIRRVADIVHSDPQAKYIVVSAPGKRDRGDEKVTDLLLACYELQQRTGLCDDALRRVKDRFDEIVRTLGLDIDLRQTFEVIREAVNGGEGKSYAASRGEYLSALVTARLLNAEFVDAAEIVRFDMDGNFDAETTDRLVRSRLGKIEGRVVVPGFYGKMPNGKIRTFSRGGSDVTGAIVARGVRADLYENWTDVDGFMAVDPRIEPNARVIEMLSYKELRELSFMGADVMHPESIFPVRAAGIPVCIKNTFNPSAKGTMIVPTDRLLGGDFCRAQRTVTGIAGRKDFSAVRIEKSMLSGKVGDTSRLLQILERHNVCLSHMPSGIDTMTLVLDVDESAAEDVQAVLREIRAQVRPDSLEYVRGLAMIAVVGHGMNRKKGTAARVFTALSRENVNIRMIDQGSSELNIIVGVENADYEKAVKALYKEFCDGAPEKQ